MDDISIFYPGCHRLLEVLGEKTIRNQPASIPNMFLHKIALVEEFTISYT